MCQLVAWLAFVFPLQAFFLTVQKEVVRRLRTLRRDNRYRQKLLVQAAGERIVLLRFGGLIASLGLGSGVEGYPFLEEYGG
jgi:hypothetical protein